MSYYYCYPTPSSSNNGNNSQNCQPQLGTNRFSSQFRPMTVYAAQNHNPYQGSSQSQMYQQQQQVSSLNQNSTEYLKNVAKHDPFCRACKEFHEWIHKQQQQESTQQRQSGPKRQGMAAQHGGCPLDREELGRSSWGLLHSMAGYFPDTPTHDQQQEMKQFISLFTKYFPCRHCSDDFTQLIRANPPDTSNRHRFSRWLCEMHNKVNAKLGKPAFDCSVVDQRWHDGFKDGSCD